MNFNGKDSRERKWPGRHWLGYLLPPHVIYDMTRRKFSNFSGEERSEDLELDLKSGRMGLGHWNGLRSTSSREGSGAGPTLG